MREKDILKGLFTKALRSACLFFCLLLIIAVSENSSASGDIKSIEDGLQSRDWQTRLAAVEKIGANKDDYSIGLLMKVAAERGEYWQVKIKAILLLGESGDPKVTGLLLSVFNYKLSNQWFIGLNGKYQWTEDLEFEIHGEDIEIDTSAENWRAGMQFGLMF